MSVFHGNPNSAQIMATVPYRFNLYAFVYKFIFHYDNFRRQNRAQIQFVPFCKFVLSAKTDICKMFLILFFVLSFDFVLLQYNNSWHLKFDDFPQRRISVINVIMTKFGISTDTSKNFLITHNLSQYSILLKCFIHIQYS